MKFIVAAFFASLYYPISLLAQTAPSPIPGSDQPVVDPGMVFKVIVDNIGSGKHVILAAAIVLLITYLFRTYAMPKLNMDTGVLPYVSLVSGLLMGLASNLVAGLSPLEAANIALISGPGASMFWSSFLKLFQKKV